jgi:hypothetical protein
MNTIIFSGTDAPHAHHGGVEILDMRVTYSVKMLATVPA